MITFFIIIGVIVYGVGVWMFIDMETVKSCEHYEGGFLNMGHTIYRHREIMPKDVRLAIIWPIFLVKFIIIYPFIMLWDIFKILLLAFGIKI